MTDEITGWVEIPGSVERFNGKHVRISVTIRNTFVHGRFQFGGPEIIVPRCKANVLLQTIGRKALRVPSVVRFNVSAIEPPEIDPNLPTSTL